MIQKDAIFATQRQFAWFRFPHGKVVCTKSYLPMDMEPVPEHHPIRLGAIADAPGTPTI
jgi:hypothetical protein